VRPSATDLIVSQSLFRYSLSEPVATMLTVLKTFDLNHSFPVRTFNRSSAAGFHDSRMGLVPFVISAAPFDTIDVTQVSPFATRLPLPENNPAWSPEGVIFRQSEKELLFPMKVPAHSALEYEFELGDGVAQITGEGIRLRKAVDQTVIWRAFRVVPAQFIRERN
jgi:hypothetical protein